MKLQRDCLGKFPAKLSANQRGQLPGTSSQQPRVMVRVQIPERPPVMLKGWQSRAASQQLQVSQLQVPAKQPVTLQEKLPVRQPANRPVRQPVNLAVKQPVSQAVKLRVTLPVMQPVKQPVKLRVMLPMKLQGSYQELVGKHLHCDGIRQRSCRRRSPHSPASTGTRPAPPPGPRRRCMRCHSPPPGAGAKAEGSPSARRLQAQQQLNIQCCIELGISLN